MKYLFVLATVLGLSACSGGTDGNSAAPAASPVAAAPAPAGRSWTETVTRTPEGYRMGNPAAPVKLVEYGSRLCPACQGFANEAYEPLTKNHVASGRVSFEFREFLIHGAADLPPALLGQCGGEAPFFPLLEAMYRSQPDFVQKWQEMAPAAQQRLQTLPPQQAVTMLAEQMGLVDFVRQRGIPEARARQCLGDMARIDALTKQTQDRGADGTVSGTPTILVNGTKVDGITWADVEKALKAAGA